MSIRRHREIAVVTAIVIGLSLVTIAPVAARGPYWAWVVVRTPTVASYTPGAMDQGNSVGGVNSVARIAVGRYTVTLGNIGGTGNGGMVHVSVFGGRPRYCAAYQWAPNGPDMDVQIRCHVRAGEPADSKFVLAFQDFPEGKAAYFRADQPTAPGYSPNPQYSYNSTPFNTNLVSRMSVGRYYVQIPGLGSAGGSFQVSAFADTNACRAQNAFAGNDGSEVIVVKCRDSFENPIDAVFDLAFMEDQGLKAVSLPRQAYLWANRPTAASYQPAAAYRWSSVDGVPTVTRSAAGRYSVELPGQRLGGAALVTPTGLGTARCTVASIRTDALPQRIGVSCFDLVGAGADSAFTLAYLK